MNLSTLLNKIAALFGERTAWGTGDANMPDANAASEFFEQYSLTSLLPYEAYDEKNQLFFNKKSMGFMLETSPLTGATPEMENILASLLTDVLPPGADVQFLLCASDKIGGILDLFEQERSGQGEIFEWLAKKRTDFLKRGTLHSLSSSGSLVLRDFKLYQVVSLPKKLESREAELKTLTETLIELRTQMQSTLKSVNIYTQNIAIENFLTQVRDWLAPKRNCYAEKARWQRLEALNLQLTDAEYRLSVLPHQLLLKSESESWDIRSFSVSQFPESMTQWRMTDAIGQLFNSALQIPCPFVISFSLRVLDQEKALARTHLKFMNKDSVAKSSLAKLQPQIEKEYRDWGHVRARLGDGDRLVQGFYQVVMWALAEEANSAERKIRDLYRANGWRLRKDSYTQLSAFLAMLPMMMSEGLHEDLRRFGRLRTLTAFNAMTLAPLQGEWKGTRRPSLLLPGRRGQVAIWNPFDNPEGNYNIAVAAKSGSGKSVFTQEYLLSIIGSGGRAWVIDVGRSYEKTCRMLQGEFIEFNEDNQICINPFTHIRDFDSSLELLKPLAAAMARPSSQTSDEEVAWLEKALRAAWKAKSHAASFDDVALWLAGQENPICQTLAHLLFPYSQEGMYGRYFVGPCTLNLNNRFVVLELEELKAKKDLQKIMLLVLMYQISERMYLGSRAQMKSCIIDEAWDLMDGDNEGAARFIETGYRRARRYNANFVTITQSINDYFKNGTSLAAYENSDNNIILQQKAESLSQLRDSKRLQMDEFTEKIYNSLKKTEDYSECVIKSPAGISVHRILLDPYARILYSSKGDEFEAVKKLEAAGYSLMQAIEIVAQKFQSIQSKEGVLNEISSS